MIFEREAIKKEDVNCSIPVHAKLAIHQQRVGGLSGNVRLRLGKQNLKGPY